MSIQISNACPAIISGGQILFVRYFSIIEEL